MMNEASHSDSKKNILKSTSIISLGTVASRILGFIRDIILARFIGTGAAADAFFVAFRIPNLFRDILGEGATNAAIVPVFSEYVARKDKEESSKFFSTLLVLFFLLLSLISILGIIFAPWIVRAIAPGFAGNFEKLTMASDLTRMLFPYLIFIGLTAFSMGILYTYRSFVSPAFSPCLLNLAMIIGALVSFKFMKEPIYGLAISVLIGGIFQLAVQIKPMMRQGLKFVMPKTFSHPGAQRVGRLLLPRLFGTAVYQLNIFIDTFCASLSSIVGSGGISAIYYANRLIQFPLGVFSLALASAILPALSGMSAQNRMDDFKKTLIFSLENTLLVMLPVSIIFVMLSTPIVKIFFERGEFNGYSTSITSTAFLFSALGLVCYGGARIMVTAFYSLQDTKTPVRVAFLCLLINAVLNFLLMKPLKIGGIALASSISSAVNFFSLFFILKSRLGALEKELLPFLKQMIIAAFAMIVFLYFGTRYFHFQNEIFSLGVLSLSSFCVFIFSCYLLRVNQLLSLIQWISKKK